MITNLQPEASGIKKKNLRRKCLKSGFTLVEVMVATVVLVVGVVVIFESFLLSLDALSVFNSRLNAQWFFNEKAWHIQNELDAPKGVFLPTTDNGLIKLGKKEYYWTSNMQLVDPLQELYLINLGLNWNQGNKKTEVKMQTMVKRFLNNSTP